ncbi:hypothetical protein QCA50_004009 [Cerrena zonata]|uniref:F-box domain-containing protein n=1 Tax=Cerrena zonata TaxID=2478898 RepID=A0AAW0GKQ6_9APHY
MSRIPAREVAQARQALEHDLEATAKRIIELKIRLNQLVPIARLSSKLLSKIFMQCITTEITDTSFNRAVNYNDRWKVTHICHHLRKVALRCPSLWSQVEIYGPETEHLNELLVRSKGASLTVHANIYIPRDQGGVKKVLTEIERIESLQISASHTTFANMFSTQPISAPRLKRVILKNPFASVDETVPFLSECRMPSLQAVQLYNFPITFTHPFFAPTLTHLILVAFDGIHPSPPRLSDLMHMLAGMPLLQHLEYASELIDDDLALQNIALVHLRSLELSTNLSRHLPTFVKLLDQLSIPTTAKALLDLASLKLIEILPKLTAPVMRVLIGGGRIGSAATTPPVGFSIQHQPEDKTCILGFWLSEPIPLHDKHTLRIALPWIPDLSDEIWAFCRSLPLSNVTACILGCPPKGYEGEIGETSLAEWRNTMGQMKDLTWLRVIGEGGMLFPSLLEHLIHPEGSNVTGCSKLETLRMESVQFISYPNPDSNLYVKELIQVVSKLPNLKTLEVSQCSHFYETDYMEFFESRVPIIWDHVVRNGIVWMCGKSFTSDTSSDDSTSDNSETSWDLNSP